MRRWVDVSEDLKNAKEFGVPYGSRTRVAAVKETQFTVILCNFAAWIALYRILRTHGNSYWTLNGRMLSSFLLGSQHGVFVLLLFRYLSAKPGRAVRSPWPVSRLEFNFGHQQAGQLSLVNIQVNLLALP